MKILQVTFVALLLSIFMAAPTHAQQTDPSSWMGELVTGTGIPSPMDQTLAEFVFPGSHDAGTYNMKLAPACDACRQEPLKTLTDIPGLAVIIAGLAGPWSAAQNETIYQQLHRGSRAFDLRFFKATSDDVLFSNGFVNQVQGIFPITDDILDLSPIVEGEYYIHHTFAGPSSAEIFNHITQFLDEPGHDKEIIILKFNNSDMKEGSANMSAATQREFLRTMFDTVGVSRFAPAATAQQTLREIQDLGHQIIVSWAGAAPTWQAPADNDISGLVWGGIADAYSGDLFGGQYPAVYDWNTEAKMLNIIGQAAALRTNDQEMFTLFAQFGPDDTLFTINPPLVGTISLGAPGMMIRRFVCNYTDLSDELLTAILDYVTALTGGLVTIPQEFLDVLALAQDGIGSIGGDILVNEGLDEGFGICTAINDDWDRFRSLEEVAAYTNPKVLPSLVALPRNKVNIVMADFFPEDFAKEAKRLNQGVVRVEVTVNAVKERECHDCLPFDGFAGTPRTALQLSNPDYYPEISFSPKDAGGVVDPDTWPLYEQHPSADARHESQWGGPWLETSGEFISPGWKAFRALTPDTPIVDIKLQIWDQDNNLCPSPLWCGQDDISRVDGALTAVVFPPLTVWVGDQSIYRQGPGLYSVGPATECGPDDWFSGNCTINLDSSHVNASLYVCQWSAVPGNTIAVLDNCDYTGANLPPNAVITKLNTTIADCTPTAPLTDTCEGFSASFSAVQPVGTADPNFPDPGGRISEWQWDCDYNGVPEEFVPGRGCRSSHVFLENLPIATGQVPSGFQFFPPDGPATITVAHRTLDTLRLASSPVSTTLTVGNRAPVVSAFALTQEPGAAEATAVVSFYEYGEDDGPFLCRVNFTGPGTAGLQAGFTVKDGTFRDPFTDQVLTAHTCTVSAELEPGSWTATLALVEDKDGARNAPGPLWEGQVVVVLPPVSNSLDDGTPGSLRNIIALSSPGDIIEIDPSMDGETVVLTQGEILFNGGRTIDARNLPNGLTISGNNNSRIFRTSGSNLVLRGLTLRDGLAADFGGCIDANSTLELTDSTLTNCTAGIAGGAIRNRGQLTMINTTIHGNQAPSHGGVYNLAQAEIFFSTISGNTATVGVGGGLSHVGQFCFVTTCLNLRQTIVAGNTAATEGPDVYFDVVGQGNPTSTVSWSGNLIGIVEGGEAASFLLVGPTVGTLANPVNARLGQLADYGGPTDTMLPFADSPAIDWGIGLGVTTVDQRGLPRPGGVQDDVGAVERQVSDPIDSDGDNVLDPNDNCPLAANPEQLDSDGDGIGENCQAIKNLADDGTEGTLRNVIANAPPGYVITFDPTTSGGSIVLTGGELSFDKDVTIDASSLPLGLTLSGNSASRVFTVISGRTLALNGLTISDGEAASFGGCINNNGGVLDIVDSTVTGCSTTGSAGGAIYSSGSMTLTNSTVSGNDQGSLGAIMHTGSVALIHSTITDNHSSSGDPATASGGIVSFGSLSMENSIVAGNTGGVNPDIWLSATSPISVSGENLVGDNSSVATQFPAGPLVGTAANPLNPMLNALADYGGSTPTRTPIAGSPAVDAAVVTGNTPATDQRGVARPQGAANDLGAVERQLADVDPDADSDTVPDTIDNCPADANTNQRDTDGDGIGDVCDALLTVVPLPDISSDGIEDIAVMREGSILAEIRSGANGALQKTLTFLNGNFSAIGAIAVPDSDGNGVAELAVLAVRNSDGRIIVEVRNITGAEAPRSIWFAANHTAVDIAVVEDDADNNGVVELAVLSRRNSDGRGLVEVKNAFGATNPVALWAGPGMTSSDVEVLGDKDANGIPEIAILSTRDSDGFIVAEIKNAAGAAMPTAVWFAQGHTAIDMTAVDDKDNNGVPEVAVLSRRNSDGRNVVEIKNAAGATAPSAVWLSGGFTAIGVKQVHDADVNGVPEIAALSVRDSDGRILVEVKNAFGATNFNALWYSPGFAARGLAILGDTDSNGAEEALVLMIRDSDGRIQVQGRNAAGNAAPKQYWFTP